MPEPSRIKLLYHGPDVDDGTMEIEDFAAALQGFSGAYTKVAGYLQTPGVNLRVSAPNRGSFEIQVLAATLMTQYGTQLQAFEQAWNWGKRIFDVVKDVMSLKKETKAQPFKISVSGTNNIVNIVTAQNVVMPMNRESLEVYDKKIIDADVEKIVNPLAPKRITSAELAYEDKVELTVNADEQKYFRPDAVQVTEKSDELTGTLISLNKQNNRGTFEMENGQHISYRYIGEDKYTFHADFSFRGAVRAFGMVEYKENNRPNHIDIQSLERLQRQMEFPH